MTKAKGEVIPISTGVELIVPDLRTENLSTDWWERSAVPAIRGGSWDQLDEWEGDLKRAASIAEALGVDSVQLQIVLRLIEIRRGEELNAVYGPPLTGPGRRKEDENYSHVNNFETDASQPTQWRWRLEAHYKDLLWEKFRAARTAYQATQTFCQKVIAKQREVEARHAQAEAARKLLEGDADDRGVRFGDFRTVLGDIPDGSVNLIFTDPPYRDEDLGVYPDLGVLAQRILINGGSLITYLGQHRLPETLDALRAAGLTFFWPIAMQHTGKFARMREFGITVRWKPLLWFVKGPWRRRDNMRWVEDLVVSTPPTKREHAWQQSVTEARYYIAALTEPDELVVDPFGGSGTTAIAAVAERRRWLTCDVDADHVAIARRRVRAAIKNTNGEDV